MTTAIDRRIAHRATCSPFLDRGALKGADAIEQMADDFRVFAANAGMVTRDDLSLMGWTAAQIDSYGTAARERARRKAAR